MKVVIVESEKIVVDFLRNEIATFSRHIEILAVFRSCKEAIELFSNLQPYQFIIMSTHLSDGLSSKIFDIADIKAPVIYLGNQPEYFFKAFTFNNAVSFLPKPLERYQLYKTFERIFNLEEHFKQANTTIQREIGKDSGLTQSKARFLARRGGDFFTFPQDEIMLFYADSRIVFLLTKENQKYVTEYNYLSDIEKYLDSSLFYRINRKHIINILFLKKFRAHDKIKLMVEMTTPVPNELIVSQDNAPEFRKWVRQLI